MSDTHRKLFELAAMPKSIVRRIASDYAWPPKTSAAAYAKEIVYCVTHAAAPIAVVPSHSHYEATFDRYDHFLAPVMQRRCYLPGRVAAFFLACQYASPTPLDGAEWGLPDGTYRMPL